MRTPVPDKKAFSAELMALSIMLGFLKTAGLARVNSLLFIYDEVRTSLPLRREAPASDVLRSAVVLLHATLEDSVRYVARSLLAQSSPEVLDEIAFPPGGRGVRFGLGALAPYRGKSVDEVLGAAVVAHLERQSFNSIGEVVASLRRCNIHLVMPRNRYASLERMIQRRHQIVHEADRVHTRRTWTDTPRGLSRRQVATWRRDVEHLIWGMEKALAKLGGGRRAAQQRVATDKARYGAPAFAGGR